eukprot:5763928-Lingulodinium_polyedra.AAC.1
MMRSLSPWPRARLLTRSPGWRSELRRVGLEPADDGSCLGPESAGGVGASVSAGRLRRASSTIV